LPSSSSSCCCCSFVAYFADLAPTQGWQQSVHSHMTVLFTCCMLYVLCAKPHAYICCGLQHTRVYMHVCACTHSHRDKQAACHAAACVMASMHTIVTTIILIIFIIALCYSGAAQHWLLGNHAAAADGGDGVAPAGVQGVSSQGCSSSRRA
jgi:hypothetical protein